MRENNKNLERIFRESTDKINLDILSDLMEARELLADIARLFALHPEINNEGLEEEIDIFLYRMAEKENIPEE